MVPLRWQPLLMLIESRFREFFREPEVIFWVYGFPLVLALGLGFAFSTKPPEPPPVDVQDTPDKARAEMVAAWLSNDAWESEKMKVEVLPEDKCKERKKKGKTALYIIAHADGNEFVYDRTNEEGVKARYWVESLLSRPVLGKKPAEQADSEPGSRYIDFLLPGLIGINIMGGGLFGVGFVLVDMRVRKLFKRLLATPLRHSDFLMAILSALLLFLMPEMAALLCMGYFWFQLPPIGIGSIIALPVVILLGALAFSGIGLLIGSRTEKTETASGLMNMVMLPMYVVSGVFFSSKRFPEEAQLFIQALPLTQLIDALREVMLEGADLGQIMWRVLILSAYAVVTFAAALYLFKWR